MRALEPEPGRESFHGVDEGVEAPVEVLEYIGSAEQGSGGWGTYYYPSIEVVDACLKSPVGTCSMSV